MSVRNHARLIVYRINKKGLEIFLVNGEDKNWEVPYTLLNDELAKDRLIELEPIKGNDGKMTQVLAFEGDWHDIPSIRSVIKADVRIVKDQIKQRFPEIEKGTFFAIKEAFKKVLPHEYAYLKELKDIMIEKNQAKYI